MGSDGRKESCVRWGPQALKNVAMVTNFWLSMGYNFGCIIASISPISFNIYSEDVMRMSADEL